LEACQDIERLYQVVPSGVQVPSILYGSAKNASEFVTLYGLCANQSNFYSEASAPAIKRVYLKRSTSTSRNQNQDQDQQHLLTERRTGSLQQKNHAYQRLSGELSGPTQSPPQNQLSHKSPSDRSDYDDDLPPQTLKGQTDGFGLRPLTSVSERTGRDGRAD